MSDLPTRVALTGVAVLLVVTVGVLRRAGQHYVGSATTGWEMTTWERFAETERGAAEQRTREVQEKVSRAQLDRQEVD
jgi:hypothetical protein